MKRLISVLICLVFLLIPLSACTDSTDDEQGIDPDFVKLRMDYNKENKRIRGESLELKKMIEECSSLLNDEQEPLDYGTEEVLRDVIEDAEQMLNDAPDNQYMPQSAEELEPIVTDLKRISFTDIMEQLQFARDAYIRSVEERNEMWKHYDKPVISMTEPQDGVYISGMYGSYMGAPNGMGTCYKIELEENILTVCGSFSYSDDVSSVDYPYMIPNNSYRFQITDETIYKNTGGELEEYYDSPQDMVNTVQKNMDTNNGPALVIVVENGKVTYVTTAS